MFLSLLCATYAFTCHSQSSLAEFPECWVKPAAELSMSTSDAFTVPCSQPSEYFPKPSLAWLLHSASSQVFAIACVCLRAHTYTHSYLLTAPSQLQLNPCVCVPFPQLDFSPLFTPPYCSPSGSFFILIFSPTAYFSLVLSAFFLTFLPLPFSPASQLCINSSPVWWSSPLALFPLISSCIPFFNIYQLLHFPPLYLAHPPINEEWMGVMEKTRLSQDIYKAVHKERRPCNGFNCICISDLYFVYACTQAGFLWEQWKDCPYPTFAPHHSDVCCVWVSAVILDAWVYISGTECTVFSGARTLTPGILCNVLGNISISHSMFELSQNLWDREKKTRISLASVDKITLIVTIGMIERCHLFTHSQKKCLFILSRPM